MRTRNEEALRRQEPTVSRRRAATVPLFAPPINKLPSESTGAVGRRAAVIRAAVFNADSVLPQSAAKFRRNSQYLLNIVSCYPHKTDGFARFPKMALTLYQGERLEFRADDICDDSPKLPGCCRITGPNVKREEF